MFELPNYTYYTDEYLGSMSKSDFDAALMDAAATVRSAIVPNTIETEDQLRAVQLAVCAMVDYSYDPALISWRAGQTSQTYADGDAMTSKALVRKYLSGTGLLCKWV